MKLEVFHFIDPMSEEPDEVYENITECLPLGERLLQVEMGLGEMVYINGYAKARLTRTAVEVEELQQAITEHQKRQESALLSAKYAL